IRLRFFKEGILFNTKSSKGKPIYHTNVMMSLGDKYAVICSECIIDPHSRGYVLATLQNSFDVMEISMEQMENHFCGNILQVHNQKGEYFIVMSETAKNGFRPEQIKFLRQYGEILSFDLTTIETIGGGSARCMMAEIFSIREPGFD
ncbi:MAG: hypothetical protein GY729_20525, partial [Desulfobacteraceae bacterium]|nr:hypothetical protein [Desulfobacteraceae bacterium]